LVDRGKDQQHVRIVLWLKPHLIEERCENKDAKVDGKPSRWAEQHSD
jgi:hypothetical protein